jgi:hypothetical protein
VGSGIDAKQWELGPTPLGGHFTTNIFFLQNSLHIAMDARAPTIDVSNSGGGRCRTCPQHPQGARHRRLQLRWWPLPDLPPAPSRGPAIDVSNSGGGRCRTSCQRPLGGLPSTSPTLMVVAVGPTASAPRGPAINVSNSGGGHSRTFCQPP